MSVEALILLAALGGGALFSAIRYRGMDDRARMIRELRAVPKLSSKSAVGADVVAIGHVRPIGIELDGPLSARPCVAYRSRVYLSNGSFWEQAGATPFALDCEDGTSVMVESAHAQFVFPALPLPDDAPDRCAEFAIARGVATRALKRCRFEEIIVIEGMRVAVVGRLLATGSPARVAGIATHPITIGVPF